MDFKRARSEEQREIRRRAILDTAAVMLNEMPVSDVSLNELARRVGLAKSNVLRYFESREAVLLELLNDFLASWIAELTSDLERGVTHGADAAVRASQVAEILSGSLANHMVLCDLFGAQGSVLEHNVSVDVVKEHKRASLKRLEELTKLIRQYLPELGERTQWFCLMSLVSAGALSAYSSPPPSLLAAYEEEPALGVLQVDFQDALQVALKSSLFGVLPRA